MPTGVVLAPMAGITDAPFRKIARRFGAALTPGEMTTADTRLWQSRKSRLRLDFDAEPRPRVVQIAGSEPDEIARAARALEALGADIVDINMGCPARKVCRKLAGSALLSDEALVGRIFEATVSAVGIPVTAKIRTGPDPQTINAVRIARIAEQSGISALTIHGRTRACRYNGAAEYETIAAVAEEIRIPLFANGDIDSPQKALEVLRVSNADGVMLGRAVEGRPWIFRDVIAFVETQNFVPPLPIGDVRDIILAHLDDMYRFYGEATGVRVARKHLTWYCRNFDGSDNFRHKVVRVENASEQFRLTREFLERQNFLAIGGAVGQRQSG